MDIVEIGSEANATASGIRALGWWDLGRGTLVLDRVFSCGEAWLLGGKARGAGGRS